MRRRRVVFNPLLRECQVFFSIDLATTSRVFLAVVMLQVLLLLERFVLTITNRSSLRLSLSIAVLSY